LGFLFLIITLPLSVSAATDVRMQVDVVAEEQGVEVNWLHANIRKAADMALPQLWNRIIPQHAMGQLPKRVKAVRFLQKAVPTEQGVSILFNEKRVLRYLKQNNIPYYAERSSDQSADQSADQSLGQAVNQSGGYAVMEPQVGQAQTAQPQMEQPSFLPQQAGQRGAGNQTSQSPFAQAPLLTGLLTIQRQASLPEQVLFEQDLAHDPRILSLTLRQVNRAGQQYQLKLKGSNDQWLREWFRQRGMMLTASVEGWVSQQAIR